MPYDAEHLAIAASTTSLAGQSALERMHRFDTALLTNPALHPEIALRILDRKPHADVVAALVRHPVAADPAVAARLSSDKRGRVRAAVIHWNGWNPTTRNLVMASANRTGEVDHALLHQLESMDTTDSDTLAANAGHAFAFAAALRPGSQITDDLLRKLLTDVKATSQAKYAAAALLAARPQLAADMAQVDKYKSLVAGSTAILAHPELAQAIGDEQALRANHTDSRWAENAKWAYIALLANPLTDQDLVDRLRKIAPRLLDTGYGSPRPHPGTGTVTTVSELTDPALVAWLAKRMWPAPGYEGTSRPWDGPALIASPGFTPEAAADLLHRATWAAQNSPLVIYPPIQAVMIATFTALAEKYPDLEDVAGPAASIVETVSEYTPTWTVDCPESCPAYLADLTNQEDICSGCEVDPQMSITKALALQWSGNRTPHTHVLDDMWTDNPLAWSLGLDLVDGFQGTFLDYANLVADSVSAPSP